MSRACWSVHKYSNDDWSIGPRPRIREVCRVTPGCVYCVTRVSDTGACSDAQRRSSPWRRRSAGAAVAVVDLGSIAPEAVYGERRVRHFWRKCYRAQFVYTLFTVWWPVRCTMFEAQLSLWLIDHCHLFTGTNPGYANCAPSSCIHVSSRASKSFAWHLILSDIFVNVIGKTCIFNVVW